jgi:hypothetical protein
MHQNVMSSLPRFLLDKGVLRHSLRGLRNVARGRSMTAEQQSALTLLLHAPAGSLFGSREALNLVRMYAPAALGAFVTERVQLLTPTRYQRRWRRRLRQRFRFGREDAHQVALASFGVDETGQQFGVDYFVTFDLRIIQRCHIPHADITRCLQRMTCQLAMPYRDADLPAVLTPQTALARLLS